MTITFVLLLSFGVFVSLKGSRVLVTLFALDLGAGPLETGVLFALHGMFPLLLAVYAGRIADRFGNRVLMYCGMSGFAASLALPYFFPSLMTLYFAVPFGGFTTMLFMVAAQNLVGQLSTAQTRTVNFSYYSLGESIASVLGPVFVGYGVDAFRHPLTFLCLSVFAAAWTCLLFYKRDAIPKMAGEARPRAAAAVTDLLAVPELRNALITNAAVMTGMDLFTLYMPVYARSIGVTATAIGLIVGAYGAAAFITRLAIPAVTARWGEHGMIAGALALSAAAFFSFPLMQNPVLLAGAAFALGLGLGCGQPLSMLLAYNTAPAGRSAEAIALRLSVSYAMHVFIPPVFGALGSVFGLAPIFWTCGILLGGGSNLNRRALRNNPRRNAKEVR